MGIEESQHQLTSTKASHAVAAVREIEASGETYALDRWLAEKVLTGIGSTAIAIQLWDDSVVLGSEQPRFTLKVNDRSALWGIAYDPEFYFGELYSSGRVSVSGELVAFLEYVYACLRAAGRKRPRYGPIQKVRHRPRLNSLNGSRQNIHHHYDLSNAFYSLWLDQEAMQYTCAYYPDPHMTLEQAQIAKLHHVCRKLQLKPGETVVEAGCGWGGLARFMAQHYGVNVRAYNISHEQIVFARNKAEQMGLSGQVEYCEEDYRNIGGEYDVFVSVGMLEHVGRQHYEALGQVINRCLKPSGRGLVHSIGRHQPGLMNAWIEKRIFPGAYPPSLQEMMDIFEPNGFVVQDVENLRLHYAKTLEHWLERFNGHEQQIGEMFGAHFVRAWRLYLAGSIAAFTMSELQLFQIMFTRVHNNALPWSRAHLYTQA